MRLLPVCALLVASVAPAAATLVRVWSVSEIEHAPALVVATVESVEPVGQFMEARLRVLRTFPADKFAPGEQFSVQYLTGDPHGILRPRLESGMTALIPLTRSDGAGWRLFATEGMNQTVPALKDPPKASATTGRAFILNELANALANGNSDRFAAAVYLRGGFAWPEGLREVLEHTMGSNEDQWLEAACAVLVSMGTPHSPIAKLMANEHLAAEADKEAAWLLSKAGNRDYPARLIRCTLRQMTDHDWGASNVLLEFKDSPLVIGGLTSRLHSDPPAAIYAAWVLIRNGQAAFLPQALDAAGKLVANPATPMEHLQPAAWLLRDDGSEAQFGALIATLRRLKTTNVMQYRSLYGAVDDRKSKRALLADAVLLDDLRPWPSAEWRSCDLAAASIQSISGQDFGTKQEMTAAERDHAVAAASAWLRSHLQ